MTIYRYEEPTPPTKNYDTPSKLEVLHKNFVIQKDPGYTLYYIVPPAGKEMHPALKGYFTKIELLKSMLDTFISEHGFEAAFVPLPVEKRRVGRPPYYKAKGKIIGDQTIENVD